MSMSFYQAAPIKQPDYVGAAMGDAKLQQQARNADQLRKQQTMEGMVQGADLGYRVSDKMGYFDKAAAPTGPAPIVDASMAGGSASDALLMQQGGDAAQLVNAGMDLGTVSSAGTAADAAAAGKAAADATAALNAGTATASTAGGSSLAAAMGPIGWGALAALALNEFL